MLCTIRSDGGQLRSSVSRVICEELAASQQLAHAVECLLLPCAQMMIWGYHKQLPLAVSCNRCTCRHRARKDDQKLFDQANQQALERLVKNFAFPSAHYGSRVALLMVPLPTLFFPGSSKIQCYLANYAADHPLVQNTISIAMSAHTEIQSANQNQACAAQGMVGQGVLFKVASWIAIAWILHGSWLQGLVVGDRTPYNRFVLQLWQALGYSCLDRFDTHQATSFCQALVQLARSILTSASMHNSVDIFLCFPVPLRTNVAALCDCPQQIVFYFVAIARCLLQRCELSLSCAQATAPMRKDAKRTFVHVFTNK